DAHNSFIPPSVPHATDLRIPRYTFPSLHALNISLTPTHPFTNASPLLICHALDDSPVCGNYSEMGGRALIFPPISSSMASFAFSLPLAVNESGRKKECFLAVVMRLRSDSL
ncbi:unnamed protein product, partial [Pleuronectes platessa]